MEWRAVIGYEGSYEVSEAGVIRSLDRTVRFADGRVRRYRGQVLAQYVDGCGYPKVTLKKQDRGNRVHVHILLAAAFIGPCPERQEVCHDDGNPSNCTRANLRYDTRAGNQADKKRHGTLLHGEKAPGARLKAPEVKAIRALRGVERVRDVAAAFGTCPSHVCNIQRGRRWAHLKD